MPPVTFSEKDMLRDKILDPGWYEVNIEDTDEGPSKNQEKPSINYTMNGVVVCNADGDPTYAGVPLKWQFNSLAIGFAIGFLRALGVNVEAGSRYDLKDFPKGKTLQVYVKTGSYQDRPKNEVTHAYRPSQIGR